MKLQIKILDPKIREKMPSYASLGSAGLDLRAVMDEPLVLQPGETKLIKTGLAIYPSPSTSRRPSLASLYRYSSVSTSTQTNSPTYPESRPASARRLLIIKRLPKHVQEKTNNIMRA